MTFLLELLAELILQAVLELLVELGLHGVSGKRPRLHPAVAFVVYVVLGAGLGALSVVFFRQRFLEGPIAAYANLLITPLVVGTLLGLVGAWRAKRGGDLVRLDHFLYGYTFALAFALARFFFSPAA